MKSKVQKPVGETLAILDNFYRPCTYKHFYFDLIIYVNYLVYVCIKGKGVGLSSTVSFGKFKLPYAIYGFIVCPCNRLYIRFLTPDNTKYFFLISVRLFKA